MSPGATGAGPAAIRAEITQGGTSPSGPAEGGAEVEEGEGEAEGVGEASLDPAGNRAGKPAGPDTKEKKKEVKIVPVPHWRASGCRYCYISTGRC